MVSFFTPTIRQPIGRYQKNAYNDARLASVGIELINRMSSLQSNVVHQISKDDAEEKRFYRFLKNKRVSSGEMLHHICQLPASNIVGRSLLVIGDSSEISLKAQISHISDAEKVGVLSDNKTAGFIIHDHLVLDADSGHALGLSDLMLWNRPVHKGPRQRSRDKRLWHQKETYCWQQSINHSQEILAEAKEILYVFDSGADIANLWAAAQGQDYDLLIRIQQHDRTLLNNELKLFAFLDELAVSGNYELPLSKLNRRNKSKGKEQNRKGRVADMEVRFAPVVLQLEAEEGLVEVPLYAIDAREKIATVPEGQDQIHWKLLTTRPVETFEQAMTFIGYYENRWQTEELNRTTKKKGFAIEETQLTTIEAIFKQTILSFEAAFRVMRLVISRDKETQQPTEEIFSHEEIECLAILNKKLEGKTEKQKNPWSKDQLAWAAWIIARLSGWKGYSSRTPAGPIRMKRGLDRFYIYFDAWNLFRPEEDVGDS
jgi:hypothetical protein